MYDEDENNDNSNNGDCYRYNSSNGDYYRYKDLESVFILI